MGISLDQSRGLFVTVGVGYAVHFVKVDLRAVLFLLVLVIPKSGALIGAVISAK